MEEEESELEDETVYQEQSPDSLRYGRGRKTTQKSFDSSVASVEVMNNRVMIR